MSHDDQPVVLPSRPLPAEITWRAVDAVELVENSLDFSATVIDWGGAVRVAAVALPLMSREEADVWIARLLQARNGVRPVLFGPSPRPGRDTVNRGSWAGIPLIDGDYDAGEDLLTVRGLAANQTNIVRIKDMFEAGGRLYEALEDASSDAQGKASFSIWPAVRASGLADGAAIEAMLPRAPFRLISTHSWKEQRAAEELIELTFELMEIP